jgi:predicted outer membrane protein
MFRRIVPIAALTLAFAAPAMAHDMSMNSPEALLNQANQMNYEEQQTAKIALSKAGDNQALMTYADTLKYDHQANEDAVSALARQKSIKLEGTESKSEITSKFNNMKGGEFDSAFLTDEIKDHEKMIGVFKSHLKVAENLRKDMAAGSHENPANNKSTTKDMGESSASNR